MPADTTTDILGLFPPGSAVDPDGELVVGGCRLADLAARWGTPMYVVDEQAVRAQVRRYRQALEAAWPNSRMVWASKAFPCITISAGSTPPASAMISSPAPATSTPMPSAAISR